MYIRVYTFTRKNYNLTRNYINAIFAFTYLKPSKNYINLSL